MEIKDLSPGSPHMISFSDSAFPQPRKSKKCPIFCNPSEDEKPLSIDVLVEPASANIKSPEAFYAQGVRELTGTENNELAGNIIWLGTLAIAEKEKPYEKNVVFQSLAEQQPGDAHEAKLCLQAMALYTHGMKYLHRAEQENRIPQSEFYIKNAMKLLRLHNETIEALNKHRRGGEQRVVVQHVQVSNGGQAIVGSVLTGGGGQQQKTSEVPHGHSTNL